MATPKKRTSKSKKANRKKIWKNKAKRNLSNALNWASFLIKKLKKEI
nr:ribosomal protein L32 [Ostreobium quekettii]